MGYPKTTNIHALLIIGLFCTHVAVATNIPKLRARCSDDSLDVVQASERIEWSAKCGHINEDEKYDALFIRENKRRDRPMYPTYANEALTEAWHAPVDRNAPCTVPDGITLVGFCTASCYTPEQELLFPDGFVSIREAKEARLPDIMTLSTSATLNDIQLTSTPVESYTQEATDTWHDILDFRMRSGGELKVTKNHPLIDSTGNVRTADTFKVGQALVQYEYGADAISEIIPFRYFGKVYNVTPKGEELNSQVVVAQGYLNGSAFYQNDGHTFLNQRILRRTIPGHLLK
jgi:hypothetical protein